MVAGSSPVLTTKKIKIMNYQITLNYGHYQKTYLAYREGNTFYYDHSSSIGCSTINVKNRRLVNYVKVK